MSVLDPSDLHVDRRALTEVELPFGCSTEVMGVGDVPRLYRLASTASSRWLRLARFRVPSPPELQQVCFAGVDLGVAAVAPNGQVVAYVELFDIDDRSASASCSLVLLGGDRAPIVAEALLRAVLGRTEAAGAIGRLVTAVPSMPEGAALTVLLACGFTEVVRLPDALRHDGGYGDEVELIRDLRHPWRHDPIDDGRGLGASTDRTG